MIVTELDKNGKTKNRVLRNRSTLVRKSRFQKYPMLLDIGFLDEEDSTTFAKIWASYIFVFVAVLITFSIVFAVGYLINSMTYQGTKVVTSKIFNPSVSSSF